MEFIQVFENRGEELQGFLARDVAPHLYALGILETCGLAGDERASVEAFALLEGGAMAHAVVVGGGGRLVLPCTAEPQAAEALGRALAGRLRVRGLLGSRGAIDGFLRGLGEPRAPKLVRPQRLFVASADDLGPFVCPALRPAEAGDIPRLVELGSAALEEARSLPVAASDLLSLHKKVSERVAAGRTYVLAEGGELIFKIDLGVKSRFGIELEGVFTVPSRRRQGIATLAVGQLSRHLLGFQPRIIIRADEGSAAQSALCLKVGYLAAQQQRWVVLD